MIPVQLIEAKLMVQRFKYRHAKSERQKGLIEQKAKVIKRQLVNT